MMKLEDCRLFDQQFTHLTHEREMTIFNTSALERHLIEKKVQPEWIAVLEEQVNMVLRDHGIEQDHFARLTDECLNRPIIFVEWRDGSHILADGNHRLVYAFRKGKEDILAWLVKQEVWKDYTIELPEGIDPHQFLRVMGNDITNDMPVIVGRY